MGQSSLDFFVEANYYLYKDNRFPEKKDILLKLVRTEKEGFTKILVLEALENYIPYSGKRRINKGNIFRVNSHYQLLQKISKEKAMARMI